MPVTTRICQRIAASTTLLVTSAQVTRHGLIVLTGALTQSRVVTLPGQARRLAVCNATSGDWDVVLTYAGGGHAVTLASEGTTLLHGDGTDLRAVTSPAPAQEISLFSAGTLVSSGLLWNPMSMNVPMASIYRTGCQRASASGARNRRKSSGDFCLKSPMRLQDMCSIRNSRPSVWLIDL